MDNSIKILVIGMYQVWNSLNICSGMPFDQDISGWDISKVTTGLDTYNSSGASHSDPLFNISSEYYFVVKRTPLDNSNIQTAVNNALSAGNSIEEYGGHISNWHVSNVTNMSQLFKNKTTFNEDISSWDVSNVTNMNQIFHTASAFNSPLNSWNVSKVTDIGYIFQNCGQFNQPLNNWNVSNVTTMYSGIANAPSFNQDLNNWNVSKVTQMGAMFNSAAKFNGNISSWNTAKVISMNYMFNRTYDFNSDISSWNVSNVTNMDSMFRDSTSFNADISSWNVSKVLNMQSIFANYLGASSANYPNSFNQDISGWSINPSAAISNFGSSSGHSDTVFASSNQYYFTIRQETISQSTIQTAVNDWISNPTNATFKYGDSISYWDTSTVTNMDSLFENASSFTGSGNNFGTGDDLPANFGNYNINGSSQPIQQWAYDLTDNTVIITEIGFYSGGYTSLMKITLEGADIPSSGRFIPGVTPFTSESALITAYADSSSNTSSLTNTFTKGTGFDDITFGNNLLASRVVKLHKEGQAVGAPSWAANAAWGAQRIYGTFTNDQKNGGYFESKWS